MAIAPTPTPTPTPAATAPTLAPLDFGDAFAAALKDDNAPLPEPEPKKDDPAAGGEPGAVAATGTPAPAEGDQKAVDDLAAAAAEANGEGGVDGGEGGAAGTGAEGGAPAPAGTPAGTPAPADSDGFTRLADLLTDRLAPQPETPKPAAEPARMPQAEDFYTEEERGIIAAYEKEWPDVARVEGIKRRGEYNMLAQHITSHVFDQFVKEMRPVMELVTGLAARQQYADLKTLEPEYDELSEKVGAWVDEMPNGILKNAYTAAITQGSAEDMQQLFSAYRTATGATATPKPGAPVTPKPATELPKPTMQAVAALAPVSTRRAAQPAVTPETFEDAFDQFAKLKDN